MPKKVNLENVVKGVKNTAENVGKAAGDIGNKSKEVAEASKKAVINAIDQNGNGEIDIEDIIIMGLRTPGIKVNREDFLRKEFFKNHPEDVVEKIVSNNPANAGISKEEVEKIADEIIKYERNCVSGISAALGVPGGAAMVATIPADIAQYYGYLLRATQKLLYLYGFPELNVEEKGHQFDTETINIITVCLGIMYGTAGANNAIKAMANALAKGVEKKLLKTALTKGTIYPIVKNVASWFGKKMTKEIFAGFFKKSIPVVGGVIGGGITFMTFKPCCDKLKESLRDTMLSNPTHEISSEEKQLVVDIEDYQEISAEDEESINVIAKND